MSTVTINYDLSDLDDNADFRLAMNAGNMRSVIVDFDAYLRAQIKYEDHDEKTTELFEAIRTRLHDSLIENGVDIGVIV